jgi:hypothetical protein
MFVGGTSHKIMTSITAEPQQTDIKEFEVALHRHDFKIVKEELVFSRYLNVYNRVVEVSLELAICLLG